MSYTYKGTEQRKPYEEPGEYLCTIEEAEMGYTRSGGDPMIKLKMRTGGGAIVFENIVLKDGMEWKIDPFLACFLPSKGVDMKVGIEVDFEKADWRAKWLIGATGRVILSLGQSTSGKKRNEVDGYVKGKVGSTPPASNKPAAAPTSASSNTPTKSSFPKQEDDDEIPF